MVEALAAGVAEGVVEVGADAWAVVPASASAWHDPQGCFPSAP